MTTARNDCSFDDFINDKRCPPTSSNGRGEGKIPKKCSSKVSGRRVPVKELPTTESKRKRKFLPEDVYSHKDPDMEMAVALSESLRQPSDPETNLKSDDTCHPSSAFDVLMSTKKEVNRGRNVNKKRRPKAKTCLEIRSCEDRRAQIEDSTMKMLYSANKDVHFDNQKHFNSTALQLEEIQSENLRKALRLESNFWRVHSLTVANLISPDVFESVSVGKSELEMANRIENQNFNQNKFFTEVRETFSCCIETNVELMNKAWCKMFWHAQNLIKNHLSRANTTDSSVLSLCSQTDLVNCHSLVLETRGLSLSLRKHFGRLTFEELTQFVHFSYTSHFIDSKMVLSISSLENMLTICKTFLSESPFKSEIIAYVEKKKKSLMTAEECDNEEMFNIYKTENQSDESSESLPNINTSDEDIFEDGDDEIHEDLSCGITNVDSKDEIPSSKLTCVDDVEDSPGDEEDFDDTTHDNTIVWSKTKSTIDKISSEFDKDEKELNLTLREEDYDQCVDDQNDHSTIVCIDKDASFIDNEHPVDPDVWDNFDNNDNACDLIHCVENELEQIHSNTFYTEMRNETIHENLADEGCVVQPIHVPDSGQLSEGDEPHFATNVCSTEISNFPKSKVETDMETPEMKRRLKEFGLKNLPRRKAIPLLKKIDEYLSQNNVKVDDDQNESLHIKSQSIPETGEENVLFEKFVTFVKSKPDLYRQILLYEPIWFEDVHQELKEKFCSGAKISQNALMDIMDNLCVTFRSRSLAQKNAKRFK